MNSAGVAFAGGFVGGLLGPLRQLSFWTDEKARRYRGRAACIAWWRNHSRRAPTARVH